MPVELGCRNCLAVCRRGQGSKRCEGARLMRRAVSGIVGDRLSVLVQCELERAGHATDDEGGAGGRRTVADGHPALWQGPTHNQRDEHQDRSQMTQYGSRCAVSRHARMLKACNVACPEVSASQGSGGFSAVPRGTRARLLQFASVAAANGDGVRVSPNAAILSATPGLKFIAWSMSASPGWDLPVQTKTRPRP